VGTDGAIGAVAVHDDVVKAAVAWAALKVEGVAALAARGAEWRDVPGAMRAIRLNHDPAGLVLELEVIVRYGIAIPEVAENVATYVRSAMTNLVGLNPHRVTIHVVGVEPE
jgi:uncharacterized alkaline shock family protein YloU